MESYLATEEDLGRLKQAVAYLRKLEAVRPDDKELSRHVTLGGLALQNAELRPVPGRGCHRLPDSTLNFS